MCGIFGFSKLTNITRQMAPIMAWEMVDRGKDAWGATNGTEIIKHVGSILDSWELPDWQQGIFHTRAATTGTPKEQENAHPFSFQTTTGQTLIGIHNGIMRKHLELNAQYSRNFPVDSMHIFAHLAEGKDLKELEGYGALAWYVDGMLHLARYNTQDLYVAQLETGEIVFCSTYSPIFYGATMFGSKVKTKFTIEPQTEYYIKQDEHGQDVIWKGRDLPFGKTWGTVMIPATPHGQDYVGTTGSSGSERYARFPQSHSSSGFRPSNTYSGADEESCFDCGRIKIDRKKQLLCWMCLKDQTDRQKRATNEARFAEVTVVS